MALNMPRTMPSSAMALVAILSLGMSGCASSSAGTPVLSLLSGSDEAASNGVLAALDGGIIGPVAGDRLSREDRVRALQAEYQALETVPVGSTVSWSGRRSGLAGEVRAAQAYQVGSQNCRQYIHTVQGAGAEPLIARGTACRDSAGAWKPLI